MDEGAQAIHRVRVVLRLPRIGIHRKFDLLLMSNVNEWIFS